MQSVHKCLYCGSDKVRKDRKYCSKGCYSLHKIKQKEEAASQPMPLCRRCGQACKALDKKYCSLDCSRKSRKGHKQSPETIAKRIANTDQSKKEAKRKETMVEKYGVDNPLLIADVVEKLSKKRKGRKHPRDEEWQEKIIESKRRNGTLKHTKEAKRKISKGVRKAFSDPDFDRSVFVKNSNNKNSKSGYFNGHYFRSSYEEMFLKFCYAYGIEVESAENKKHSVKYVSNDGSIRTYFPDFYLPGCNTTVEVKPVTMLNVGENQNKILTACGNTCNYVVLTELDGFLWEEDWDEFYNCQVRYWFDPVLDYDGRNVVYGQTAAFV